MAKQKAWILGTEATEILSRNSGRAIDPAYVRLRASQGKIRSRMVDGRTREYYREDVENLVVAKKGTSEKKNSNAA